VSAPTDIATDRGDGGEYEDAAGTRRLPPTQMADRITQRLDQERLGVPAVRMRGLHRVQAEWKFVCMALNLRLMATMHTGWTRPGTASAGTSQDSQRLHHALCPRPQGAAAGANTAIPSASINLEVIRK